MHVFSFSFISGFCLGLEFFFQEDLESEGATFAFNIDLGIFRMMYTKYKDGDGCLIPV